MTVRQSTHLALFPSWMVDTLNKESFDYAPLEGEGYKPPAMNSRKDLLETFDRDVAAARKALEGASDAQLMATCELARGRKDHLLDAADCRPAGNGAESHDPPSRPTWSLSAAQRSAGAGHLRPFGRRASVSKMSASRATAILAVPVHGRDARGRAPEGAPGWRGESPFQVNVTCNRLQLRRGDTGWRAGGGEPLVRTIRNSIRPV